MRKIPTLFVRDENDRRYVTDVVTPGCEWVLAGEGMATRKYDGTCVMFDGENWWARREVKPGKGEPPNFLAVEHDETTGKTVGWEPIEQSSFVKFFREAVEAETGGILPPRRGTYELIGPKVNGNPERAGKHELVYHDEAEQYWIGGRSVSPAEAIAAARECGWEGIVWHHPDGRMAKLKVRDYPPTP